MRKLLGMGALLALGLLSGCARGRVTTVIKADGSWTRSDVFTGSEKKEGNMAPGIEETFAIPSGAGWKSHEGKKGDDRTVTVERNVAAGGVVRGDITLKGDPDETKAKVTLVNEATVVKVGPRRFEYRETLRWKGEAPKMLDNLKPENLAAIKAVLPKALATDANVKALAEKTALLAIPVMFGPGDPLLAIGFLHPDLAERRATQRIGGVLLKALEEQFGDKMQPAERREVAHRLIAETFTFAKPSTPDPANGPPKPSGGSLTPLMFIVSGPGHLVSSNGEVDELTGEVYWALFSDAVSFKDVVLTAIWESN